MLGIAIGGESGGCGKTSLAARYDRKHPSTQSCADDLRDNIRRHFPFENANAPAHPFVTNLYQPRLLDEARRAEDESQRLWQQAGEAGRASRSYVLITVLLASALFCGGTASKFEKHWIRRAVLALGLFAFIFAALCLVSLPIQL